MSRQIDPRRVDVRRFAEEQDTAAGELPLSAFPRLSAEAGVGAGDASAATDAAGARGATWELHGEVRPGAMGAKVPWLHLDARLQVGMVCQRCLTPVEVDLHADRWFRFEKNEELAAAADELSEEDVLVESRDFDFVDLIEDELLMEMPIAPMHDECPVPVDLKTADRAFEDPGQERPNPFEALQALKKAGKPDGA
ncbi:conserved hypothetical protein [Burkholderiales bacterium 8X]|nr:conserved hypothetical protein [Burkholderiales bacterium 8X]